MKGEIVFSWSEPPTPQAPDDVQRWTRRSAEGSSEEPTGGSSVAAGEEALSHHSHRHNAAEAEP
jgi:hypothetical protein